MDRYFLLPAAHLVLENNLILHNCNVLFYFKFFFSVSFCVFHCFKPFLGIVCTVSIDVVHTI